MQAFSDIPVLKDHLLTVIILVPLVGAFCTFFLRSDRVVRWFALAVSVVDFILAVPLVLNFDRTTHGMQFVERHGWIPSLNVQYYLGVDGISVLFVFLTALLGWICVLASWNAIDKKVRDFMMSLQIMQAAMLGVFSALDVVLFYLCWEAMFIPMYLLIGRWGGANRIYATLKFFLYTFFGSVFMLVGIVALYNAGGTFDLQELMKHGYTFDFQVFAFALFFIAFSIKVPMFPFHTWLPAAHVEAPTAGSIILAGVLLKTGAYGFMRFLLPMFPDASQFFSTPVIVLSFIAIIYGAFLALSQDDMKKLVAYSSVSHMGFVTLGLFLLNKNGIEGGIIQMFNHGITTGALFLCVGMIYERTHTRDLKDYGWAAKKVPYYAVSLLIFSLASMGFPGTNGFVGEILILIGAYENYKLNVLVLIAGIMLGAAYMLWMYHRVSFGAAEGHGAHGDDEGHGHGDEEHPVRDLSPREVVAIAAFVVFVFWVGFHPMSFLDIMHESVGQLLTQVNGPAAAISSIAGH
ncbi:MAG: NADH-quinone oxidoreductase subunit M [Deltaproteobacteria bacterium]|nr:NADH-quinone oxidoreductase subunit M [Deltaproteobacteria bacterium]